MGRWGPPSSFYGATFINGALLFIRMAAKFDMTLELAQGFHQFFEDHKDKDDYKFLLNRMNALEVRFKDFKCTCPKIGCK